MPRSKDFAAVQCRYEWTGLALDTRERGPAQFMTEQVSVFILVACILWNSSAI